jgi:hypothetical protein
MPVGSPSAAMIPSNDFIRCVTIRVPNICNPSATHLSRSKAKIQKRPVKFYPSFNYILEAL